MTTSKRTTRGTSTTRGASTAGRPDDGATPASAAPPRRHSHRRRARASANRTSSSSRTTESRTAPTEAPRPATVTHRLRRPPISDRNIEASSPATRSRIGSPRRRRWTSDCEARAGRRGIRLTKPSWWATSAARTPALPSSMPPVRALEHPGASGSGGELPTFLDALAHLLRSEPARSAAAGRGHRRGRARRRRDGALHQSRLGHLRRGTSRIRLRASGARE